MRRIAPLRNATRSDATPCRAPQRSPIVRPYRSKGHSPRNKPSCSRPGTFRAVPVSAPLRGSLQRPASHRSPIAVGQRSRPSTTWASLRAEAWETSAVHRSALPRCAPHCAAPPRIASRRSPIAFGQRSRPSSTRSALRGQDREPPHRSSSLCTASPRLAHPSLVSSTNKNPPQLDQPYVVKVGNRRFAMHRTAPRRSAALRSAAHRIASLCPAALRSPIAPDPRIKDRTQHQQPSVVKLVKTARRRATPRHAPPRNSTLRPASQRSPIVQPVHD